MRRFSDFLSAISQVNGLGNGGKVDWLFHCGMLFSSREKWWGDFGFRHSVHEGIDITYFRTPQKQLQCFDDSIRIPAMEDGILINICDDFLGQTLVVEHGSTRDSNRQILFAYAHIIPEPHMKKGRIIKKQELIARVCDTRKNPLLPPHLHFSCFEVGQTVPCEHLDWTLFSNNFKANPIHPFFL